MSITIPYDVGAESLAPDWRSRVAWPVALSDTHAHGRAAWKALWPVVRSLEPGQQDILLLAGARIVWQCLALGEAASVVQAAAERGWTIEGGPSAVHYLMTASERASPPAELAPSPFKTAKETSYAGLRRFVRSMALSAPSAWPRLFVTPDAVALSHNSMMHSFAQAHGQAVQFMHADDIMRKARNGASTNGKAPDWTSEIAEPLAEAMLAGRSLEPAYRWRFVRLAAPFIEQQLLLAHRDSAALQQLPKLPSQIWYGGQLSARYIATEARRRGAEVTGFEHGWGLACEDAADLTAYAELAVVDRYVAMTPASADRLKVSKAHAIASPFRRIEFVPGTGDAEARRLPLDRKRSNGRSRPTVLYAPTIIAGFRQFLPPLLPDPIHLDWQFRVCENLMSLPVEFVCRPHPEGLFRDRPHPLRGLLQTADAAFEDLMARTDVFVFDFQQSTTFGRALCSDRVIVVIDFGTPAFDAETEAAIRRRCRVVKARFDEFNRPHVPTEELRDAILEPAREPPDATFFRALMIDR